MAISERTRKMLWGRAGNRCAKCRRELVADPSHIGDREAVIGDECHIVARSKTGPRADQISNELLDEYANLILLCKDDHKLVDDQPNYYTSEKLREIKAAHERWVRTALEPSLQPRWTIPKDLKIELRLMVSGQELLSLIARSYECELANVEPKDMEECELIGDFFQYLQDLGNAWEDIEASERIREEFNVNEQIRCLAQHGLFIYAGRYVKTLHAGSHQDPWPVAVISIKRLPSLGKGATAAHNR